MNDGCETVGNQPCMQVALWVNNDRFAIDI